MILFATTIFYIPHGLQEQVDRALWKNPSA
jgi:hypothetical protein